MNGVTPELRAHALRKIRGAVRSGRLAPASVAESMGKGDAGIAALFPVERLPAPPTVPLASLPALSAGMTTAEMISSSRWFITLALRRDCAPERLLESLQAPEATASVVANLLLDTWNRLLASYRPDYLPASVKGETVQMKAVPTQFTDEPISFYDEATHLFQITPNRISRLFLGTEEPDFGVLFHALKKLEEAMAYPILAGDLLDARDAYMEYIAPEFMEDLRQHVTWPDGAAEPIVDQEAVETLMDSFGYTPADAEHYVEMLVSGMKLRRSVEASAPSEAELQAAIDSPQTPNARIARAALDAAAKLEPLADDKRIGFCVPQPGCPVHLMATPMEDYSFHDLMEAVNLECQEQAPTIGFYLEREISMPALDRHMERIVAEMVIADYIASLLLATFPAEE